LILILSFAKIYVVFSKLNISIKVGIPPPPYALINTQAHLTFSFLIFLWANNFRIVTDIKFCKIHAGFSKVNMDI